MNICYLDFWPGFDNNSNWFNLLFSDYFNGRVINFNSSPQEADIILFSSFGGSHTSHLNSKAIKIFYTGENHMPPHYCDLSFSFSQNSNGGKNLRLPIWYLYINWWNQPDFSHARITPQMLAKKWDPEEIISRENFCSIIIGNPVKNRIDVALKLNEIRPVHGFGSVFGNPYSGDKIELLKSYKYNICFENTIADGYTTEKLLEAKVAGCIPIYYGAATTDFNKDSYINYADFKDLDSLSDYIKNLEKDKNLSAKIINQEFFNNQPSLDFIFNFLKKKGI